MYICDGKFQDSQQLIVNESFPMSVALHNAVHETKNYKTIWIVCNSGTSISWKFDLEYTYTNDI